MPGIVSEVVVVVVFFVLVGGSGIVPPVIFVKKSFINVIGPGVVLVSILLVLAVQYESITESSVDLLLVLSMPVYSRLNPNVGFFNTIKRTLNTNRIYTNTT